MNTYKHSITFNDHINAHQQLQVKKTKTPKQQHSRFEILKKSLL